MASDEELRDVVAGFREAEDSLRTLTGEAEKLQTAAAALDAADVAVHESAVQLKDTADKLADSSIQLGTLAAQLATTTEALLKADPEGVKRELGRSVEQVERLRSRIDETAGESRSNFESLSKSLGQVRALATAAVLFALLAAGLVVALR